MSGSHQRFPRASTAKPTFLTGSSIQPMKIIISGIGEVGSHLAGLLVEKGHELILIDPDPASVAAIEEHIDAKIILGSATSAALLAEAGVHGADLFLSLTSDDEVNLVACSVAKGLGAKKAVARYHAPARRDHQVFSYSRHFDIDYLVSPERLAAANLAKEVHSPISPVLDQFARGSIEVLQVTISPESSATGKPLNEIKLPARVRVGIIRRDGKVLIPGAREQLQPGDEAILIGAPQSITEATRLLEGKEREKKSRIVVYGGDDIGIALIENFNPGEVQIKLIEPHRAKCEFIAEHYPWVEVIQGEAIHSRLLVQENIVEADIFVAATRDDENNVMACLQAAKLGIHPTLLVIHRPDYAGVLSDLGDLIGVSATISPRLVTGRELLRYVTTEPYLVLWELPGEEPQIIRLRLDAPESKLFGTAIRDLKWPPHTLLLGIERSDGTIVPTAADTIQSRDSLLLLTFKSNRAEVLELFRPAIG